VNSTTGHVNYLMPDRQGTADVSLDASSSTVTFRNYTPFGDVRGAAPSTWVGQRGYLGVGTNDATTGLTNIGAREYDPSIGRFISSDPLFEAGDAAQMGGYAYAGNDPVSRVDPSGLMALDDDGNSAPAHAPSTTTVGYSRVYVPGEGDPVAEGWEGYAKALQTMNNFYEKNWFSRLNGNVVLARVSVPTSSGPVSRVVAFLSSKVGKREGPLIEGLESDGVTIYQTDIGEGNGHSEVAASLWKKDTATQEADLGGRSNGADDYYSTNTTCGPACAKDGSEFMDDPQRPITVGTRGYVRGQAITDNGLEAMKASGAEGSTSLEVLVSHLKKAGLMPSAEDAAPEADAAEGGPGESAPPEGAGGMLPPVRGPLDGHEEMGAS